MIQIVSDSFSVPTTPPTDAIYINGQPYLPPYNPAPTPAPADPVPADREEVKEDDDDEEEEIEEEGAQADGPASIDG